MERKRSEHANGPIENSWLVSDERQPEPGEMAQEGLKRTWRKPMDQWPSTKDSQSGQ